VTLKSSLFVSKGDSMTNISFKERIRTELFNAAKQYGTPERETGSC